MLLNGALRTFYFNYRNSLLEQGVYRKLKNILIEVFSNLKGVTTNANIS